MNNIPGRHLTVFNSQSLLQVGGQWNENKQTLDLPFQVWICHSICSKHKLFSNHFIFSKKYVIRDEMKASHFSSTKLKNKMNNCILLTRNEYLSLKNFDFESGLSFFL